MKPLLGWNIVFALGAALTAAVPAHAQDLAGWSPDLMFLQWGKAEDASSSTLGVIWKSDWGRPLGAGRVSLYWEAGVGRWRAEYAETGSRSSWVTQLGLTPVLRWNLGSAGPQWFVEGGIGANVLLPIYRSREKRFSTAFNFGDHLGLGLQFGEGDRHELVLRVQHFSNGGIKRPNPGEDFVQVRYVLHL